MQRLPPLKGHTVAQAIAINNEEVILGWSGPAGANPTETVVWTRVRSNSPWVPRAVLGMIGYDIGANQGTVGLGAGFNAVFGNPDYAGTIYNAWVLGIARSSTGLVAGWEDYGGGVVRAFVADLAGGLTRLDFDAWAYGVNACGLVVGQYYSAAAIWDPGC